jgi:hypothetical protein
MPRSLLKCFVFALPLLVVVFSVLMGGFLLTRATGDEPAAKVLQWIAVAALMGIVADLILLVGALGLRALAERDDGPRPPTES